MKMKYFASAFLLLLFVGMLCFSAAAAEASSGGFNAGLSVDRTNEAAGSFTVTVQDSDVLTEKKPTLRLPCSYAAAQVIAPDDSIQTGVIADGTVSFRVFMGGTYTVTSGGLTRTEINPNFSDADIPAELKQLGLNTVATIESVMKTEIQQISGAAQPVATELYDVILMYSEDGGKTWIKADKEHFPSDGRLPVSLPVPAGTSPETHNYTILHMFTSSDFGKTPGKMEKPSYTARLGSDGVYYLDFHVTGLSPITVGWTEKEAAPALDPDMLQLLLMMMTQNFDITAEAAEGGSVILSADKVKFDKSTTFTVVPDAGYAIGKITVNGKEVQAVDGVVTLKHVRRDQKISVTFEKLPWVNPYSDVPADAAYLDALAYVCESGLMNGISADGTLFDPEASMTRAMFITVLGRLAGVGDEFIGALGFADVPADAYYAPYVGWAKFAGITSGDGTGNFGSDDALRVEQAVTFLARYRAHMGYPVESDASLSGYTDAADISAWAADAMAWAVGNGICIGEDGKLNPHSNVSRAMAAQMIFAFVNAFGE